VWLLRSEQKIADTPHNRSSQQATTERERSNKAIQKVLSQRFVHLRRGGASYGHVLQRAAW